MRAISTIKQIISASAPMRNKADPLSSCETDALFGEDVMICDDSLADWVLVRLETDQYLAWVERDHLGDLPEPTHHICTMRALITRGEDIKTPTLGYLPLAARVHVIEQNRRVAQISLGQGTTGYIPSDHIRPCDEYCEDWVATAEQLLGVPYRWGGRDSIGLDCSALVQLAMASGGLPSPRNSGDQEKTLGISLSSLTELGRGDLVFWRGHVGVMQDNSQLLHANAWHNMVKSEPLAEAISRIKANNGGDVTRLARILQ
ncbi:MAG: hypothetical protein CBC12_10450 [Candidatus Puniceispirillum sp. TMED52]|nr:hypothetical protein [SAR116 cluster bacterium]OUU46837.1 MAG: hypothetical protein CBC12_10450 [Candidatus Puniceispirillum sp. TMED52]|tara:strand:- start:391 stop:1170 length:780 start_codon:yes stop_codon:yes gene_type:complete